MISQKLLLDSTKVGILSVVLGYLIIFVMKIKKVAIFTTQAGITDLTY